MRATIVAILVVLAVLVGCRQIFGLHEIAARDAGRDAPSTLGDTPPSDAPHRDAPGGDAGPDLGISCGAGQSCDVSTQFCCFKAASWICPLRGAGCGAPIECDDTADCPGGWCCAAYDNNHNLTSASCTPNGTTCVPPSGGGSVRFCDPNTNSCPSAQPFCDPTTVNGTPPGYHECKAPL